MVIEPGSFPVSSEKYLSYLLKFLHFRNLTQRREVMHWKQYPLYLWMQFLQKMTAVFVIRQTQQSLKSLVPQRQQEFLPQDQVNHQIILYAVIGVSVNLWNIQVYFFKYAVLYLSQYDYDLPLATTKASHQNKD